MGCEQVWRKGVLGECRKKTGEGEGAERAAKKGEHASLEEELRASLGF